MASRLGQRWLACALASLACVAAFPGSAAAQQGSGTEQTQNAPTKKDAARVLELVKNANDEFDRGEFSDALRLYQQAYDLYPEAVLLYRIGISAEKVGDTRRAVDAYNAYVAAAPEGDATAAALAERVVKLEAMLPSRVTVTTTPPGATVYLDSADSKALGTTPVTLEFEPGERVIVTRLDGYRVAKEAVKLEGGDDAEVTMTLEPLKRLSSSQPDVVVVDEGRESGVDLGPWGYVAGATGVALLGTGAVFEILSQARESDVNEYDKRAPGASREELEELKTQSRGYYDTAVATFIAGGVFTATGLVLILLDATTSDESADVTASRLRLDFAPAPGGGWVGLSGQF